MNARVASAPTRKLTVDEESALGMKLHARAQQTAARREAQQEEQERAAREALRQAHPVEPGAGARSASKLFADGARKAAKVNEAQQALEEAACKASARGKVGRQGVSAAEQEAMVHRLTHRT